MDNNRVKIRRCLPRLVILLIMVSIFTLYQPLKAAVTGKIAGLVIDSETGDPLPFANILVIGTDLGAATGVDGYYTILRIPPGTYDVQCRMMGYRSVTMTGVEVSIDHTSNMNFSLSPTEIEVEGITVIAQKPIIKKDVSATQFSLPDEEIATIPMSNTAEILAMQAGVQLSVSDEEGLGLSIRGGEIAESDFQVDNISLKSGYSDLYNMNIPKTSIQEVQLLSGGFNAEYGQVRSGLVNVVTKKGEFDKYSGSFEFRISPPGKKHWGPNPFDPDESPIWNIYAGEKAFEGIDSLDVELWESTNGEEGYPETFKGWNAIAEEYLNDDDTTNDITPMNALEIWKYEHRPRAYADEPDYDLDATFSGPIPLIPKLSFVVSYRRQDHQYIFPLSTKNEVMETLLGKIGYKLFANAKLEVQGIYGKTSGSGFSTAGSSFTGTAGGYFSTRFAAEQTSEGFNYENMFAPETWGLRTQKFARVAAKLTHVLNTNTYFELQYIYGENWLDIHAMPPETATVTIGEVEYTEFQGSQWPVIRDQAGIFIIGGNSNYMDVSTNWSHNFKLDFTSQVNKYHEIKTGLGLILPSYRTRRAWWTWGQSNPDSAINETLPECQVWDGNPTFADFYIQDKLELEGMIANVGLRIDYMDANYAGYQLDTLWDTYYTPDNFDIDGVLFWRSRKTVQSEGKIKIQPRIGVSFPVTVNSKLYFNYGHFYETPNPSYLYNVKGSSKYDITAILANPNLDWPRTVSYEFGYEHNIADLFKIHFATYYKDITGELMQITGHDYWHTVETGIYRNYRYSDVKGIDLRVNKPWGKFLTFWSNFDYVIKSYGYTMPENLYEKKSEQDAEDINAEDIKVSVTPYFRAGLTLKTPLDWGPGSEILGANPLGGFSFSIMYRWEDGGEFIFNPDDPTEQQHWIEEVSKSYTDLKISKTISFGGVEGRIFMDIFNLFNQKYLNTGSFTDDERIVYRQSLHLPWEEGEEKGDDKWGDWDKEHIDIGWRSWNRFLNPRNITFGISFNF